MGWIFCGVGEYVGGEFLMWWNIYIFYVIILRINLIVVYFLSFLNYFGCFLDFRFFIFSLSLRGFKNGMSYD